MSLDAIPPLETPIIDLSISQDVAVSTVRARGVDMQVIHDDDGPGRAEAGPALKLLLFGRTHRGVTQ